MTNKIGTIERRAERKPSGAQIELRRTKGIKYRVLVRDLSPLGCSIDLVDRVELQEILWIKFPGLESFEADVCWTRDFIAGVEFRRPLHPAVFDMLLSVKGPAAT